MKLDRNTVVLLVAVLAVVGLITWRVSSPAPVPARKAETSALPVIQVEPKETIDLFLAQFEDETFTSIGLVRVEAVDRELILGWNKKWIELPEHYRRDTVKKIAEPWAMYFGGVTRIFAVPTGHELARYTPRRGVEDVER